MTHAKKAPIDCPIKYSKALVNSISPEDKSPKVTAGLIWAPLCWLA